MRDAARRGVSSATRSPRVAEVFGGLGRRGLLPRAVWRRLPTHQPIVARLPGDATFRWSGPEWLSRRLLWRGEVDEPETHVVWCEQARVARTIVDVGANLGFYALTAAAVNDAARVIAFEPVPGTAAELRANILENGWGDRVEVHEIAVADRTGTAQFHVAERFDRMASLDVGGFRGRSGRLIDVTVGTLDDLVAERVDLVKIDVEGFEDAVLRGMSRILAEDRPVVIFEMLRDGPVDAVEGRLREAGYEICHLGPHGPVVVDRIVPDPVECFRNFLARPPEPARGETAITSETSSPPGS